VTMRFPWARCGREHRPASDLQRWHTTRGQTDTRRRFVVSPDPRRVDFKSVHPSSYRRLSTWERHCRPSGCFGVASRPTEGLPTHGLQASGPPGYGYTAIGDGGGGARAPGGTGGAGGAGAPGLIVFYLVAEGIVVKQACRALGWLGDSLGWLSIWLIVRCRREQAQGPVIVEHV
jgi:hypothetical protein